jgi:hypothetical protein
MMDDDFHYDIFLSYSDNDHDKVKEIYEQFNAAGLRVFYARIDLSERVGTAEWEKYILETVDKSRHLGVYSSKDAALSKWVIREVEAFQSAHQEDADQLILAIPDPELSPAELEKVLASMPGLSSVLRPRDWSHALEIVARKRIGQLSAALTTANENLEKTKDLARQAFEYYRHSRFWKPFSEPSGQDLHIFTCGRDTPEDTNQRGVGGRTSIDKWDYQAAVDITHHFARYHRDIGVVIEQPVSKARIDEGTRAFDTSEFTQKLINRNCIVIGSPDVSDFAEITLARLLDIPPYRPDWPVNTGFRIRKAGRRFSTFYEQSPGDKPDGIQVIRDGQPEEFFASGDDLDHGVMILADSPYAAPGLRPKILILAGHSGVATRAMSLLLTNEDRWCLNAFYRLDQDIAVMDGPLAAVIEVSYNRTGGHDGRGDDRIINTHEGSIRVGSVLPLKA